MNLFDNFERDSSGSDEKHASPFQFINKSAPHDWVRSVLESWFRDFPSHGQHDLRNRFRSNETPNHEGALFELFLHALFIRLNCSLDVHPEINGTNARPDFRVRHGKVHFYLEATSVGQTNGPFTRNKNEEDVIKKLETLESPHFNIAIDMNGTLSESLSREDVCRPFEELLTAHDPDEIQRLIDEEGRQAAPSRTLEYGNWRLRGRLVPIGHQGRIGKENRHIRTHHAVGKRTDVVSPLRKALEKKSRKYGSPDGPLVVAINARDPFYNGKPNDMDLLFGDEQIGYLEENSEWSSHIGRSQNGLWSQDQCHRIDAIAIFHKIDALNWPYASAYLYLNPRKMDTVLPDVLLQLPHAKVCGGRMEWFEGKNIQQILGIGGN